ncbi:BQ2448_6341 [Microbotryum intermedium]|uniref:BQ2448_6341 protein n=1 Tax=Microbotryum intermedium TaxID=269621 RepID=A0A238FNZ7_9BASI|nr:BQ2448_6341 [Microbotryum intermedium]
MKFSMLLAAAASALVATTIAAPATNVKQSSNLVARDGDISLVKACILACVLNVAGCALTIVKGGECACVSGCNTTSTDDDEHDGHKI